MYEIKAGIETNWADMAKHGHNREVTELSAKVNANLHAFFNWPLVWRVGNHLLALLYQVVVAS